MQVPRIDDVQNRLEPHVTMVAPVPDEYLEGGENRRTDQMMGAGGWRRRTCNSSPCQGPGTSSRWTGQPVNQNVRMGRAPARGAAPTQRRQRTLQLDVATNEKLGMVAHALCV